MNRPTTGLSSGHHLVRQEHRCLGRQVCIETEFAPARLAVHPWRYLAVVVLAFEAAHPPAHLGFGMFRILGKTS